MAARVKKNAEQDPVWWAAHVMKAKSGEPLPYHPKMGLTETEYKEFLDMVGSVSLKKTKTIQVVVKHEEKRVTLTFGDQLPQLKEIVINLADDTITTAYGTASRDNNIKAVPEQKATGPWDGFQWKKRETSLLNLNATLLRVSIGKLKDKNRGIISFDVKYFTGTSKTLADCILFYDLEPPK